MRDNLGAFSTELSNGWNSSADSNTVARDKGVLVKTYDELVEKVARLTFYNQQHNLFFRGHKKDVGFEKKSSPNENSPSTLYPQAYRKCEVGTIKGCEKLICEILPKAEKLLIHKLKKQGFKHHSKTIRGMERYPEATWAILQHYGFPTPLLDITTSLHVAASFACREMQYNDFKKDLTKDGFIYILALPEIQGYLSYHAHDCLVIARLQGVCPPESKRPHFQQGFLVGTIPHTPQKPERYKYRDFRLRLVGKFRIKDTSSFWKNSEYKPLGPKALMPKHDKMKDIVEEVKNEFLPDFWKRFVPEKQEIKSRV